MPLRKRPRSPSATLKQDTSLPVEVQADQFAVNNADGTAVFTGNVRGRYPGRNEACGCRGEGAATAPISTSIDQLIATGGVTISNLADAAEAREAVYTIDTAA